MNKRARVGLALAVTGAIALTVWVAFRATQVPGSSQLDPADGAVDTTLQLPTTTPATPTSATGLVPRTTDPGPAPGVIPLTIPHPKMDGTNGYVIEASSFDRTDGRDGSTIWWRAPYLGIGEGTPEGAALLPYAPGAYWTQGDRITYSCAYGFLWQTGTLIGRFTFVNIPDAAGYAHIIDFGMAEGDYYWDGTPNDSLGGTAAQAYRPKFCHEAALADPSYESYAGPPERPRIVYWTSDNQVAEIRDYRTVVPFSPAVKFRLLSVSGPFQSPDGEGRIIPVTSRATVVAYENDLPVVVIYYDGLGSGVVTADLP